MPTLVVPNLLVLMQPFSEVVQEHYQANGFAKTTHFLNADLYNSILACDNLFLEINAINILLKFLFST